MADQYTDWEREWPVDETVLIRYVFKDFIEWIYPFYVDEYQNIYLANQPFGSDDVPPIEVDFFKREDVEITGWMSLPEARPTEQDAGGGDDG